MAGEITPLIVGSWFFTLDADAPTEIRPSEFFDRVGRCLEGIAGVTNIEIDLASWPADDEPIPHEPISNPRYGAYLGPHWDFQSVDFSVRLPMDPESTSGPVRFRVLMRYGWQMPVSRVAVQDPTSHGYTTLGAVAVYRYLADRTKDSPQGVRLSCIPPIFAHAKVFLHAGQRPEAARAPFWRIAHSAPDYRRYDIGFDLSTSPDPVRDFLGEVTSEVDVYYQIVHEEGDRQQRWAAIDNLVNGLTEMRRRSGLRGSLKRMRGADRRTSEAIICLTEFAAHDFATAADFRRQVRNLYTVGGTTYIQELVESELADRAVYPVEQLSGLVQLYQERRLTDREMIVVVTTSLLGGAAGAAATLLAGG